MTNMLVLCRILRCVLLFKAGKNGYSGSVRKIRIGGRMVDVSMNDMIRIMEENEKLKAENEILLKTVEQMNRTVNRLLNRFVIVHAEEGSDQVLHS